MATELEPDLELELSQCLCLCVLILTLLMQSSSGKSRRDVEVTGISRKSKFSPCMQEKHHVKC